MTTKMAITMAIKLRVNRISQIATDTIQVLEKEYSDEDVINEVEGFVLSIEKTITEINNFIIDYDELNNQG